MSDASLRRARRLRVALPFLAMVLIWSTTWIVIRDQLGVVPPAWSIAYRFAIASAVMFGWARLRREPVALDGYGHGFAMVFAALQFVLNFNLVYHAEHYITSGLVALAFALLIVPNAVLARIFLGQPIPGRFMIGAAVGIGGLALMFLNELSAFASGRMGSGTAYGLALTLAGVLTVSVSNVMHASRRAAHYPMVPLLAWSMLYAGIGDTLLALATAGPPVIEPRAGYLAGLVYLGVLGSGLAFALYFNLLRAIGPARVAYIGVITPVVALAISTMVEGYRWTPAAALGAVLAVAGLVVALRARSPAR